MKHPADINSIWQSFLTATGIVTTSEPSSKSTINNIINKSGDYLNEAINDFETFLNIEYACKTEDEKTKEFLKKCRLNNRNDDVLDIFIETLASKKPYLKNYETGKYIETTSQEFRELLEKEMNKFNEKKDQSKDQSTKREEFFKEVGLYKELDAMTVKKNKQYYQATLNHINDANNKGPWNLDLAVKTFKSFLEIEDSYYASQSKTREFLRICRHDKRRQEVLDIFISAFSSSIKLIKDSNADNKIITNGFEFRKKLAEAMFFCDEQKIMKDQMESQRVSNEKKSKEIEDFKFKFKKFEEKVDKEILKTKKELARIADDPYVTNLIKSFKEKKKQKKELARIVDDSYETNLIKSFHEKKKREKESSESSETISKFLLEDYTKNKDAVDQFKKKLLKEIKDEEETCLSYKSKIDSEFGKIKKDLSSYIEDFIEHKDTEEFEALKEFAKEAWKKSAIFKQDFQVPLSYSEDLRLKELKELKSSSSKSSKLKKELDKAINAIENSGARCEEDFENSGARCEEDFAALIYFDEKLYRKFKNGYDYYAYEIESKDKKAKAKADAKAKAEAEAEAEAEAKAKAEAEEAERQEILSELPKSPFLSTIKLDTLKGIYKQYQDAKKNIKKTEEETAAEAAAAKDSHHPNPLGWMESLVGGWINSKTPSPSPGMREESCTIDHNDRNAPKASRRRRRNTGSPINNLLTDIGGFLGLGK